MEVIPMWWGGGRGRGGHRWRWMFYLTGLPGWMRFGFSPGWVGRSPNGLPPYLAGRMFGFPQVPFQQMQMQGLSKEQMREFLKQQREILRAQLREIERRLKELEESE